jgi:hypothetical protein
VKLYLVCDKTKRALSIGDVSWVTTDGQVDLDVTSVIDKCRPNVPRDQTPYYEYVSSFQGENANIYVAPCDKVPEGHVMITGYWEHSYITVPKAKRRKVAA